MVLGVVGVDEMARCLEERAMVMLATLSGDAEACGTWMVWAPAWTEMLGQIEEITRVVMAAKALREVAEYLRVRQGVTQQEAG